MSENDNGTTAIEAQENNLGTVSDKEFLGNDNDWTGPDYATVRIPDPSERPKYEYAAEERQADLFRLLRKYGHPGNLPKTQREYGEEYGVSQQCISKDIERIRSYIAAHAADEAISNTKMVVERARKELLEEDPKKAVEVQMKFNEFLFELGELDREPERREVASVTTRMEAEELSDEEREPFDQLAEQMRKVNDVEDEEPIDVEAREVDEEDDGE